MLPSNYGSTGTCRNSGVPNESVPGGRNGAQPSASWNEKGNWWSVNDGQGGPIQHVGEDGSLLDGIGQPIPDRNGGNVEPTIGQPAPAPTPPAPTSSRMEKVNDWLNEHLPESLKNYLREHPYGSNSSPAGAGAGERQRRKKRRRRLQPRRLLRRRRRNQRQKSKLFELRSRSKRTWVNKHVAIFTTKK